MMETQITLTWSAVVTIKFPDTIECVRRVFRTRLLQVYFNKKWEAGGGGGVNS